MKEFFKYKFGYVNIDDQNIYLTNSGNWSECRKLQEKSYRTGIKTVGKRLKIGVLILIVCVIVIGNIVFSIQSGSFKLLPIITSILAAFGLYKIFMRDLGSQYLIPIKNIIALKIRDQNLTINFRDHKNRIQTKPLTEVENFKWESLDQLRSAINTDNKQ